MPREVWQQLLMLAVRMRGRQELRQGMKPAVQVCKDAKSLTETIARVNALTRARFSPNQMKNYLLSPA